MSFLLIKARRPKRSRLIIGTTAKTWSGERNTRCYKFSKTVWTISVHGAVHRSQQFKAASHVASGVLVVPPSRCIGHGDTNVGRRAPLIAGPSQVDVTARLWSLDHLKSMWQRASNTVPGCNSKSIRDMSSVCTSVRFEALEQIVFALRNDYWRRQFGRCGWRVRSSTKWNRDARQGRVCLPRWSRCVHIFRWEEDLAAEQGGS